MCSSDLHAAQAAIDALHAATPADPAHPPRYPGESTLRTRAHNLREGIPIDDTVWQSFLTLESSNKN